MSKVNNGKTFFQELNGLKGLLCFFIFCTHYFSRLCYKTLELSPVIYKIQLFQHGYLAVEIFFCISGFLSALAYKKREIDFFQYVQKRLKFYPQIAFTILFCIILVIIDKFVLCANALHEELTIHKILSSFSLSTMWLNNSYPLSGNLWYIEILFLCYVLYYVLCKLLHKAHHLYLYGCICMVVLGYMCITNSFQFPFLYGTVGRGYYSFFVGVLLYEYLLNTEPSKKTIIGLLCVVIFAFFLIQYTDMTYIGNRYIVFGGFVAPVCLIATMKLPLLRSLFSMKAFQILGNYSLAFYLLHQNILDGIRMLNIKFKLQIDTSSTMIFVGIFGICLLAAIFMELIYKKQKCSN